MARILITDDDPDIRQLIAFTLQDEGYEIAMAKNGREAIEQITESHPDLLVLDLMMPELDGHGVMRELEERRLRQGMRILVLTAKGSERDFKEGYDFGADHYQTKPFDPDDLIQVVADLLAASPLELQATRQVEHERAKLLAELESIFGDDKTRP